MRHAASDNSASPTIDSFNSRQMTNPPADDDDEQQRPLRVNHSHERLTHSQGGLSDVEVDGSDSVVSDSPAVVPGQQQQQQLPRGFSTASVRSGRSVASSVPPNSLAQAKGAVLAAAPVHNMRWHRVKNLHHDKETDTDPSSSMSPMPPSKKLGPVQKISSILSRRSAAGGGGGDDDAAKKRRQQQEDEQEALLTSHNTGSFAWEALYDSPPGTNNSDKFKRGIVKDTRGGPNSGGAAGGQMPVAVGNGSFARQASAGASQQEKRTLVVPGSMFTYGATEAERRRSGFGRTGSSNSLAPSDTDSNAPVERTGDSVNKSGNSSRRQTRGGSARISGLSNASENGSFLDEGNVKATNAISFEEGLLLRSEKLVEFANFCLSHFFWFRSGYLLLVILSSSLLIYAGEHDKIHYLDALYVSVSATTSTGLVTTNVWEFGTFATIVYHVAIILGTVPNFDFVVSMMRAYIAEDEEEWRELRLVGMCSFWLTFTIYVSGFVLLCINLDWIRAARLATSSFGNCVFNQVSIQHDPFSLLIITLLTVSGYCLYPLVLRAWLRLVSIVCRSDFVRNNFASETWRASLQNALEQPATHVHIHLFDAPGTKWCFFYWFVITLVQMIPLLFHDNMNFMVALAQTTGNRHSGLMLIDYRNLNPGTVVLFILVLYLPPIWVPRVTQRAVKSDEGLMDLLAEQDAETSPSNAGGGANQTVSASGRRSSASGSSVGGGYRGRGDINATLAPSAAAAAAHGSFHDHPGATGSDSDPDREGDSPLSAPRLYPASNRHHHLYGFHSPHSASSPDLAGSSGTQQHPRASGAQHGGQQQQRHRTLSTRMSVMRQSLRKTVVMLDDQWYGYAYNATDAIAALDDGHLDARSAFRLVRQALQTMILEDKFWLLVATAIICAVEQAHSTVYLAQIHEVAFEVFGAYSTSGVTLYGVGNKWIKNGMSLSGEFTRFSQAILMIVMFCGGVRGLVFFKVPSMTPVRD